MPDSTKIKVTKLDVAKRQIETAIRLYFAGGDPVSIHTLASAAAESIRASATERGISNVSKTLETRVKPEYKKLIFKQFKEAQNFFKHGGRNPNEEYVFESRVNDLIILDACAMFEGLNSSKQTPLMFAYSMYCCLKYPDIYNPPEEFAEEFAAFLSMPLPSPQEYFTAWCKYDPSFKSSGFLSIPQWLTPAPKSTLFKQSRNRWSKNTCDRGAPAEQTFVRAWLALATFGWHIERHGNDQT